MSFRHISATGHAHSLGHTSLFRWLTVSLATAAFIFAAACGSDGAASDDDSTPKPGATVDGDTLRWSPPWEEGDSREVTVTSSVQYSPEFEALVEGYAELLQDPMLGGTAVPNDIFDSQQSESASGTVRFIEAGPDGALAEYEIDLEQMLGSMTDQMGTAGMTGEDMAQFTAMLNLVSQLGFSLEFEIAPNGELTGVANLQETADSLRGFMESLTMLAGSQEGAEEFMDAETQALIEKAFTELPQTELAKLIALTGANGVTGNMFLMRQGEYTVGEPVAVEGTVPSSFGLPVAGVATYSLTSVSDTQATMEVQVTAAPVDVEAMVLQFATELSAIFGEDVKVDEVTAAFAEMTPEDREMLEAVVDMVFQPYTVTLTLDTVTGWVTGAEWEAEFSIPDGFMGGSGDAPEGLEGFEGFGMTMVFNSTVE